MASMQHVSLLLLSTLMSCLAQGPVLTYPKGNEPVDKTPMHQYYICLDQTYTFQNGITYPGSTMWSEKSSFGVPYDGIGSLYRYSNYKPALTRAQQALVRNQTCDNRIPGIFCPSAAFPIPKPAKGARSPYDIRDAWQQIDQPYDDFTGITFRNLALARHTWLQVVRAAAIQGKITSYKVVGDDGYWETVNYIGVTSFWIMGVWYPDIFNTLYRGYYEPAAYMWFRKHSRDLGKPLGLHLDAVTRNDSILAIKHLEEIGYFHATIAPTRYEKPKYWMFMIAFHRAFMHTVRFFLGDTLTKEMEDATEEVSIVTNMLHAHFMLQYATGCRSRAGLQDFVKDAPRPGTPGFAGNPRPDPAPASEGAFNPEGRK